MSAHNRIDMAKRTWFTADTHFGHGNIILYCRRPYMPASDIDACLAYPRGTTLPTELKQRLEAATAAMDEDMIRRWNDTVAPEDDVWHLGDFCMSNRRFNVYEYMRRLQGQKHLIRGNHDREDVWACPQWISSQNYAELRCEKTDLVLFHYAMRVWNGSFGSRAIQLFGHSHGMLSAIAGQCDVGVDCWDYRPVSLNQIMERITCNG